MLCRWRWPHICWWFSCQEAGSVCPLLESRLACACLEQAPTADVVPARPGLQVNGSFHPGPCSESPWRHVTTQLRDPERGPGTSRRWRGLSRNHLPAVPIWGPGRWWSLKDLSVLVQTVWYSGRWTWLQPNTTLFGPVWSSMEQRITQLSHWP